MSDVHLPVLKESSEAFTTGGKVIYPIKVSIDETMTPVSTATIVCPKDEIYKRWQIFELYTASGLSGYYRIRSIDVDYPSETVTYQLEHMVAQVGDYVVRNAVSGEYTAKNAILNIWRGPDSSSSSDDSYQGTRWQLGNTNVLANYTVNVDAKYGDNLLTTILGVLKDCDGVYMTYNFNTEPWTINFAYMDYDTDADCSYGMLSRNVSSARVNWDFTDLCTRVRYYYGNQWRAQDAETAIVNKYGYVNVTIDVSSASTLIIAQYIARQYLLQHQEPRISVDIDGYDLYSITGVVQDKFTIGRPFHLHIPEFNRGFYRCITRCRWGDVYGDPLRVQVTLGDTDPTLWAYLQPIKKK